MSVRRFPPPPGQFGAGGTPEKRADDRSTEAPMQFEWERARDFPGSPFHPANQDGEPARKRTHYDAMEIDTPPRPTPHSFAPSSSSLAPHAQAQAQAQADLDFDAATFSPTAAFNLHQARAASPQPPAAQASSSMAVAIVDDFAEEDNTSTLPLPTSGPRRRKDRARRKQDSDDEPEGDEARQLSRMASRLGGKGEFSFQVHHHHAPAGGAAGAGAEVAEVGRKWFHSGTPYVLLGYLQFSSLLLLSVLLLSLLLFTLHTLYYDIQSRLAALTIELRAEILHCAKSYVDNKCQPETRLPVLARQCEKWEECMSQEVVVSGRTRVVAETVAEVVNGFVEVISLRTMLFVSLTLVLTIYGSSVALSLLPSRNAPPPSSSPYNLGPPHFQHLGQHPQQYYASLPPGMGQPGQGQGGWQVGPPSPAVPSEGEFKKKGWL